MSILKYKKNIFSQNGEDGIIEYITNKLNIKNGNFIEFGAWDGKLNSNTYNLYNQGWEGIYIECDSNKYKDLVENFKDDSKITCLNKMVGFNNDDNLDYIIETSQHKNKIFDLVSIDVDGCDFNIFQKMSKYLPKIIMIEINAGHSPNYDKEIPIHIAKNNVGQSLTIINKEAEKKGYFSLCYTGNLFLIKNEYKELFKDDTKNLQYIYIDFLYNLESTNKGGLHYLFIKFVINKIYNGFLFENDILKNVCIQLLLNKTRILNCNCIKCGGEFHPTWCIKHLQN